MKKLIISIKSPAQTLDEVRARLERAQKKAGRVTPHYEISFSDMKQFKKFISNIDMLTSIQLFKPNSIYELASIMQKDVGNVNRMINFFEEIGAIRIEENVVGSRNVKTPLVDYDKIEFDLVA
jgi:predicted transcriptional regulator